MQCNLALLNSFVPRWAISFHLTPQERRAGLEIWAEKARNSRKTFLVYFLWYCPFDCNIEAAVRELEAGACRDRR